MSVDKTARKLQCDETFNATHTTQCAACFLTQMTPADDTRKLCKPASTQRTQKRKKVRNRRAWRRRNGQNARTNTVPVLALGAMRTLRVLRLL